MSMPHQLEYAVTTLKLKPESGTIKARCPLPVYTVLPHLSVRDPSGASNLPDGKKKAVRGVNGRFEAPASWWRASESNRECSQVKTYMDRVRRDEEVQYRLRTQADAASTSWLVSQQCA